MHLDVLSIDYYSQLNSVLLSPSSGMVIVGYSALFENVESVRKNFVKSNDIIVSFGKKLKFIHHIVSSTSNSCESLRCLSFDPSFYEIPIHISLKTLDALLILNNRCTHVESPTALSDRMKKQMQDYSVCMNYFINSCSAETRTDDVRGSYVSALKLIKTSAGASVPVSFNK